MNFPKKNKTVVEDTKTVKENAEVRRKRLENVLALQKRHPFLDRFLMLAGIAAIVIIAIPFIYISFQLSIFNLIGDGFDYLMNGDGQSYTGILDLFGTIGDSGMVPIFQIGWDRAGWLFCLIGTVVLFAIIAILVYLVIIYIRDFATIVKGIILMLSKNTEGVTEIIKEQVSDTKSVTGTDRKPIAKKKTKKVEETRAEEKDLSSTETIDKMIDKVKTELTEEKKSSVIDYDNLSDDELNSLLGKK